MSFVVIEQIYSALLLDLIAKSTGTRCGSKNFQLANAINRVRLYFTFDLSLSSAIKKQSMLYIVYKQVHAFEYTHSPLLC